MDTASLIIGAALWAVRIAFAAAFAFALYRGFVWAEGKL